MKPEELTKRFMMISNGKNPFIAVIFFSEGQTERLKRLCAFNSSLDDII